MKFPSLPKGSLFFTTSLKRHREGRLLDWTWVAVDTKFHPSTLRGSLTTCTDHEVLTVQEVKMSNRSLDLGSKPSPALREQAWANIPSWLSRIPDSSLQELKHLPPPMGIASLLTVSLRPSPSFSFPRTEIRPGGKGRHCFERPEVGLGSGEAETGGGA